MAAFVVQLLTIRFASQSFSPLFMKAVLAFSYGLIVIGVMRNLRWRGIRLIGIGLLMNIMVMFANGGFMPVSPEAVGQAGLSNRIAHVQPGEYVTGTKGMLQLASATRLRWLSDFVALSPINRVVSPGDIIIVSGFLLFLVEAFKSKRQGSFPCRAAAKQHQT